MGRVVSQESESPSSPSPSTASSYSPRQAIDVLSSLVSFSHSVKVFAVKWQTIRHKLDELTASLVAIESCDSEQNPILSAILSGIMVCAGDCYDLARRCVDVSYSGKLLMQSDLDVLAARFDRHLGNLSGVCTAGVLSHGGFAIVVSRPGPSACRDDIRFYVRDLLTRLKIGDGEMKKQALVNLSSAVDEDERYGRVVVELGEIVPILVNLLDSPEIEIRDESARLVCSISNFDPHKPILIGAGVIAPLIRVLETGSESGKIMSTGCLIKLTQNSDNAWSVSAHGGVTSLLKLISAADSSPDIISPASAVLKNLLPVEEIKRFMIEEGAISTFIKLSRSPHEAVQITAVEFLQNIASGEEPVNQSVRAMIRILDPNSASSSSTKSRETALRAIENLCFQSRNCISQLTTFGFLDPLLYFLRNGEFSLKELSLKVACRLAGTSDEARKVMGDAGFTPEFVKFLDAKSPEVRVMAGQALLGMLTIPRNKKRFLHDDSSIKIILQLLDDGVAEEQVVEETNQHGNKKVLIQILMSLTASNSGRRKIAGSGYLKSIEKLAEADGSSDGKKLVKKLGAGRIRTLFNGIIWHS
ncbi:unnamed protein product [Linum tenue]|uniref:DUF7032 domain-containing protein n=1 Tax=Linum tenue TaxID=586396 RepID=A0AAV0L9U7_9ROSI|nr:unnamed protein product [Linum tenue]